ncbi:MAG: MBL fold metallo-hydrolase [Candidatus Lokiarchaeota archaeon]|nr:MBL fold metallo-hydrolase [Candidatus Lokiarchaeota archaeon]
MKGPFEVFTDVYCVGGGGISSAGDCLIYLIDAREELILIDVGVTDHDRILNNVKKLGFDTNKITSIIITHCHIDHVGNLKILKNILKAKLYAHELDAEVLEKGGEKTADFFYGIKYKPVKIDIKFRQSLEKIIIGNKELNILHIPGHTPGGIAPYLDIYETRILFSQDTHGPLFPNFGSDRKKFVESLKKMQELDSDILCEGHFGIYKGKKEVYNYIQQYINEFSR